MTRPATRIEIRDILEQRRQAYLNSLGLRVTEQGIETRYTEDGQPRVCEA